MNAKFNGAGSRAWAQGFTAAALCAAAFVLLQLPARAQNVIWTNSGSGLWADAGNWTNTFSLNSAPSNSNVYITSPSISKTVTIDAATPAGNLTVTNLNIWSHNAINTLVLSSNSTPLNVLGTLTVGQWDPVNGFGEGALVVNGGQLVTTNAADWTYIGGGYNGTMTMLGGTWLGNMVGVGWGGYGKLTLAGGTSVLSSVLIAFFNSGDVLLTGGQLVTTNGPGSFDVGHYQGTVGSMTVSNGEWLAHDVSVGSSAAARGNLNIAGGTNWFNNSAIVGGTAGATGTVYVTDGILAITNASGTAKLVVGNSGVGTMTMSGGAVIADELYVTNGSLSTFSASGGSLLVKEATIGSSFSLTNSTGGFANNLTVTSSGSLSGTNGVFALYGNFVNQSTNRTRFDLSRSTVVFSNGVGMNHTLNLTNSGAVDMGSNVLNIASMSTNFGIGTLSISLSNNVTLTGVKSGATTNALYVGWLDLSAWNTNAGSSLTNTLLAALTLPDINLYYDKNVAGNAYLQGNTYSLWSGLLIPIPEPNALALTVAAGLVMVAVYRRRSVG